MDYNRDGMVIHPAPIRSIWRTYKVDNIMNFLGALPSAASLGLVWGIMAIGLYITYKILELSDLTVDGSFCTGGAVCAMMLYKGFSVWMAMPAAFIAGMAAGFITGVLHNKCKIPAILAGILTQLSLWPINLTIMGIAAEKNTESFLNVSSRNFDVMVASGFVKAVEKGSKPFFMHPLFTLGIFTAVIIGILYWFFGTERGCSIRATGANENMARAQGINTNANKMLGLMVANGLVALSGSLFTQYQGFATIDMGSGAIVNGLAAIVIGDVLFGKLFKNFAMKLLAVSLGAVIYFSIIQAVLGLFSIPSDYLKLSSAMIVAIFLTVSNLVPGRKTNKTRKEAQHA